LSRVVAGGEGLRVVDDAFDATPLGKWRLGAWGDVMGVAGCLIIPNKNSE